MNFDEYVRDLKENSEAISLFEHNNIDGEKLKQIIENPAIQLPKYSDFYKKVKDWVSDYCLFPNVSEYSEISPIIKLFIEQYHEKRFNNIEDTAKKYIEERENKLDPILGFHDYKTTINEMGFILSVDTGIISNISEIVHLSSGFDLKGLSQIYQSILNGDERLRLSTAVLVGKYYLDNEEYENLDSKIKSLISNKKISKTALPHKSNTSISNTTPLGFNKSFRTKSTKDIRQILFDEFNRVSEPTPVSLLFNILCGMLIYSKKKQQTYLQPHNNNLYKFNGQQYMLAIILDDIFDTTPQIRSKLDKIAFFRFALQIIHTIGSDNTNKNLIMPKYDKKVGSKYDKKCQSILRQGKKNQSKIDKNDTMFINTKDQFHKLIIDLGLITS